MNRAIRVPPPGVPTVAVPFRAEAGAAVRRKQAAERGPGFSWRGALRTAGRVVVALGAGGLLCSTAVWTWRWATRAPVFAVRTIQFTGLLHASETELLRRSGLQPGQNLFRIDVAEATRALEGHPWVASVRIERRLPDALAIEVHEHRAAALVQLGTLYVLDEQGELFKRVAPSDGLDVPLLTGLGRVEWSEHRGAARLRLLAALQLLDLWRAHTPSLGMLREVHLEEGGGMTLSVLTGDGAPLDAGGLQEIRLGTGSFPLKLERISRIRAALAQRGERAARIDLDNPGRPEWVAAQLVQTSRTSAQDERGTHGAEER